MPLSESFPLLETYVQSRAIQVMRIVAHDAPIPTPTYKKSLYSNVFLLAAVGPAVAVAAQRKEILMLKRPASPHTFSTFIEVVLPNTYYVEHYC